MSTKRYDPVQSRFYMFTELIQYGFIPFEARPKSSSRYLLYKGTPFKMRVSNHPIAHPERYPEILRSVVMIERFTHHEIEQRALKEFTVFKDRLALRLQS